MTMKKYIYIYKRLPKGKSKMDNPEKLVTLGTQDKDR